MKVAIIGAGITGLYLAWKLSEKGHEVTVFEKREKIGKEVCSGLFSKKILKFIPESKSLIENEIDSCLIHFPGQTLKIEFSEKFFVMSHYELDNLMAGLAQKAGAKIILNATRNVLVLLQGFDRVIGCDGPLSETRRSLKLKEPEFYSGIQGFLSSQNGSNYVETWPTKNGFIWRIPRDREVEYGIIEKAGAAKKNFDDFLAENNLHLERIKSAVIAQAPTPKFWLWGQGLIVPSRSEITLCGEAAGLTKPWSGGGVVWGLTAAEILLQNFPDFLKYRNMLRKFFLPKIILSKTAKRIVYFLGFNFPWLLPKNVKIEGDFLI